MSGGGGAGGRADGADGADGEPGAVCAHTHLYSALAPFGMPPPSPPPATFLEILERVWWRLDRALDERALRASARLYLGEALLAGTTTLIDHHESPDFIDGSLDVLAEAAEALGVRVALCYGATERNRGRAEAAAGLAECARFARAAAGRPLLRALVGLHASFTVSDDTVREAGILASELGTVVHVHVAEDRADVEDARQRGYAGPLERLLALGALPAGSILAHGVWLDEAQVRAADAARLWLVQNPRSNAGNRVGYPAALAASTRVAVGTDGYPADMAIEHAALAAEAARHEGLAAGSPVLAARRVSGWLLAAERIGSVSAYPHITISNYPNIRISGDADRIERDPAGVVRRVVVGGRVVVEDGRLTGADLDELRARAREEAPRLWARMAAMAATAATAPL